MHLLYDFKIKKFGLFVVKDMAKMNRKVVQSYPRIKDVNDQYVGYFDPSTITDHQTKIATEKLHEIIENAIVYAQAKSSREILSINPTLTGKELVNKLERKGSDLFRYFIKYCGDPASTAFDCNGKHYSVIAKENFRNRTIQKERMNAGWRYQSIAKDAARLTGRFETVSDINSKEADFNVIAKYKSQKGQINIYVSVKNRSNTMGGQDWPKAIYALEDAAASDKNKFGDYLCVFGIAMEKGGRNIKAAQNTHTPYSMNTEIWFSDFFWPFVTNFGYDEIAKAVLDVLIKSGQLSSLDVAIPQQVIDGFGGECAAYGLLDAQGNFNDPYRLVEVFCGKIAKLKPLKAAKSKLAKSANKRAKKKP